MNCAYMYCHDCHMGKSKGCINPIYICFPVLQITSCPFLRSYSLIGHKSYAFFVPQRTCSFGGFDLTNRPLYSPSTVCDPHVSTQNTKDPVLSGWLCYHGNNFVRKL